MTVGDLRRIANPKMNSQFITSYQTSKDIMRQLRRAEVNSRSFSVKLVPFFKTDDDLQTCYKLWKFLRTYIKYKREPRSRQTAKTIQRFVVDQVGDCKHYATASVGILNACGIPTWFVMVGQDRHRKRPNHAYAMSLVGKKLIVIDPCKKEFNVECIHFYRWNVPPKKV